MRPAKRKKKADAKEKGVSLLGEADLPPRTGPLLGVPDAFTSLCNGLATHRGYPQQVIQVVHCAYRCPKPQCRGQQRIYRRSEADALALPGFAFGLDIIIEVGQLRLKEHRTIDEIHHLLTERLAPLGQTISRREMLFLFEAYSALLRAGTEVSQDAAWKEEVRGNQGLILSIDGIQPDRGNETIYLVRDLLTQRIVTADNVTESTKERLKQMLAPVVALNLPVIGVISDAQPTELQAVADLWPGVPHQICQFHAKRARRATDLQCRCSCQERYVYQDATKDARISAKSPQTFTRSG